MKKQKVRVRGSILITVAYVGALLAAAVGVYFYSSSHNLATESKVREHAASVQDTAEFAAELAIAHLADMEFKVENDQAVSIENDWVGRNPFAATGEGVAQRQITGFLNGNEYRIRVRAVRETKGNNILPEQWLPDINPGDYHYGKDEVRMFTGAYEITAVARSAVRSTDAGGAPVELAAQGGVRTVVNLEYSSLANLQDKVAALHVDQRELLTDLNVRVSGEDHYATRATVNKGLVEVVIEGLGNIKGIPSQLFSVTNAYWSIGRMTLQYYDATKHKNQVPDNDVNPYNPSIPRTNKFSSSTIDRMMISRVPESKRPVDQYVFGGKYSSRYWQKQQPSGSWLKYGNGRSVTLDKDTGIINETSDPLTASSNYAMSTLAVSDRSNFLNLYLNYLGNSPHDWAAAHPHDYASNADVEKWKQSWRQMSLGYHSYNKTQSISYVFRVPLDNDKSKPRRRWAVKMWIKNPKGQFLVRNYSNAYQKVDSPSLDASSAWQSTWDGTYRWAYYYGYYDPRWGRDCHFHLGDFASATGGGRCTLHTRLLTLEEFLGYRLLKDEDGVPCKIVVPGSSSDLSATAINPQAEALYATLLRTEIIKGNNARYIVGGIPDFLLDANGEKVPFWTVLDAQGKGIVAFDEARQRAKTPDNYGVFKMRPQDFPPLEEGLRVYDDATRKWEVYKTLADFAWERNIADVGEPEDLRRVIDVHMVIEDSPEIADNVSPMYFDMGLTLSVVLPKEMEVKQDDDWLRKALRQWWEGVPENSLTGNVAVKALSSLPSEEILKEKGIDETERLKRYYKEFGFEQWHPGEVTGVTTATDNDSVPSGFNLASLNPKTGKIGSADKFNSNKFYYTNDELMAIINEHMEEYFFENLRKGRWIDEDEYNAAVKAGDDVKVNELLNKARNAKVLSFIQAANRGSGKELHPISKRFDDEKYANRELRETQVDALKMPLEVVTARSFAAMAFGVSKPLVPAAYVRMNLNTGALTPLTWRDVDPVNGTRDLIPPTEMAIPFLPGEFAVPSGAKSLELPRPGQPVAYVPMQAREDALLQANGRPLQAKFVWHPQSYESERGGETFNAIHKAPAWFTPYEAPMKDVNKLEHRGAIGWHRGGHSPDISNAVEAPEHARMIYTDNNEFVIIARKGFFPYHTVDIDGKTYLAAVTLESGAPVNLEDCKPYLLSPEAMPSFTVSGDEIDGAGILLVAGNLNIRTRFAYHGTLIVLGDITVAPTKVSHSNRNDEIYSNREYRDEAGNILEYDVNERKWFAVINGKKVFSNVVQEWLGHLIVQGKVMVGGKIYSSHGTGNSTSPSAGPYMGDGVIDIRSSRQAIQETTGDWIKAAPYEGFKTSRFGWGAGVDTVDINKLWSE